MIGKREGHDTVITMRLIDARKEKVYPHSKNLQVTMPSLKIILKL